MFRALVGRSAARAAALLAALVGVLGGFQFLLVLIATQQEEAQSFDLMTRLAPAFVQRQLGPSLPVILSFGGLVTLGYFHVAVVLMVVMLAVFIATELAADVEGGYVDLLLARPLARHWLVTRSLLLVLAAPAILVAAMAAATALALATIAPSGAIWPRSTTIALLAGHLVAVAWCFGAVALAVASAARRRLTALGPVAILAVSLYLLDVLGGAWPPLAPFTVISPFHYYQGASVLSGSANSARDLLVLGSAAAVFASIAYWRFTQRDL